MEGTTTVPISWLLEGPLTVVMDGNEFTNYETTANQETGETNLVIIHPDGHHDSVITGTNILLRISLFSINSACHTGCSNCFGQNASYSAREACLPN